MRKLLFALVLLLSFFGCNRNQNAKQPTSDLRFCGRWMSGDSIHPNMEYYLFRRDGTFSDLLDADAHIKDKFLQPISWQIDSDRLVLRYNLNRYLFHIVKIPRALRMVYKVKFITDSSMVLASPATKHYPETIITTLKRMKLNGKYIQSE